MAILFISILLLPFCFSQAVNDQRNDVTCSQGSCSTVTYNLRRHKSNQFYYVFTSTSTVQCDNSICSSCMTKTDWHLSVDGNIMSRSFTNCNTIETLKNITDLFPTPSSAVSDIQCLNYVCTKSTYALRNHVVSVVDTGPCDNAYCNSCYILTQWSQKTATVLQRFALSCLARSQISLLDFFIIPGSTTSAFWDGGRVVALIISCVAFVVLIIVLAVCFCGKK